MTAIANDAVSLSASPCEKSSPMRAHLGVPLRGHTQKKKKGVRKRMILSSVQCHYLNTSMYKYIFMHCSVYSIHVHYISTLLPHQLNAKEKKEALSFWHIHKIQTRVGFRMRTTILSLSPYLAPMYGALSC